MRLYESSSLLNIHAHYIIPSWILLSCKILCWIHPLRVPQVRINLCVHITLKAITNPTSSLLTNMYQVQTILTVPYNEIYHCKCQFKEWAYYQHTFFTVLIKWGYGYMISLKFATHKFSWMSLCVHCMLICIYRVLKILL